MTGPSSEQRVLTVRYVADDESAASDGASALAEVESTPPLSADWATTADRIRDGGADCVVFAETPTTAAGSHLLEVVDACGATPLVLFAESTYPASAAARTEGIDGYVRRNGADAVAHLADEIGWVCRTNGSTAGEPDDATASDDRESEDAGGTPMPAGDSPVVAEPAPAPDDVPSADDEERVEHEERPTAAVAERDRLRDAFRAIPRPAALVDLEDGEPIVRDATDAFEDAFDCAREAVRGDPLTAYTAAPGLEEPAAALTAALRADERRAFDGRRRTADGVRDVRVTVAPLEGGADGENAGLVEYDDVTESTRLERDRAASGDRLERVGRVIAEEVPTPLNVARGYLELAEETGDAEHFAEVDRAHERLRTLLGHLHAVAARGDPIVVETEPVAVDDAARRAWPAVDAGDARLRTATDRALEADPVRLREVLEETFRAVIDAERASVRDGEGDDGAAGDPALTITVGVVDDGFHVVAERASVENEERATAPDDGRPADPAQSSLDLERVERIADAHGWRVSVGEPPGATVVVRPEEGWDDATGASGGR